MTKPDTKIQPRKCVDCDMEADVHIGEHGFCNDHYSARAARMRRNADRRILDGNIYRDPTPLESKQRQIADMAYFERKRKAPPEELKQASAKLKPAGSFAKKYGKAETSTPDDAEIIGTKT